jgi:hypothetical protein
MMTILILTQQKRHIRHPICGTLRFVFGLDEINQLGVLLIVKRNSRLEARQH